MTGFSTIGTVFALLRWIPGWVDGYRSLRGKSGVEGDKAVQLVAVVLGVLAVMAVSLGADAVGVGGDSAVQADYTAPVVVGRIEAREVTESSGLSASECQDVLWTHNDAGNDALVFAMDLTGKHLGTWRVEGAHNTDWESIATSRDAATGKCSLIIADIGDNDLARPHAEIYRVAEPQIAAPTGSTAGAPLRTEPAESLRYTYAGGSRNAETVLVHPATGDIYVVTKEKKGPASVHRIKPAFGTGGEVQRAEKVAEVSVPSSPEGLITGGSLSPDGRRLMLCDVKGGYEFVLPADAAHDQIWQQKPKPVNLGDRPQGEGVSYSRDGLTLYASSEKRNAPLFMIKRK